MLALAKKIQDTTRTHFLKQRIMDASKLQTRPDPVISALLREKALEKWQLDALARSDKIEAAERAKALLQEEKNAQLKLDIAKANKSAEVACFKKALEEAKLARQTDKAETESLEVRKRLLFKRFAAKLANKLIDWTKHKITPGQLKALEDVYSSGQATGLRFGTVPEFQE